MTTDPTLRLERLSNEIVREAGLKALRTGENPYGLEWFEIDSADAWRELIAKYREADREALSAKFGDVASNWGFIRQGLLEAIKIIADKHAPINPIIASHEHDTEEI